jgi:TolA-binding protein
MRIFILTLFFTASAAVLLNAMDTQSTEEIINSILRDDVKLSRPKTEKTADIDKQKSGPGEKQAVKGKPAKEKSITPPSESDSALFTTAVQMFNAERYEPAKKKFIEFRSKFPQSQKIDQTAVYLGRVNMKLNQYDDAVREFSSLKEESGEYQAALFYTGEAYLKMGKSDRAIEYFSRVSSQYPAFFLADEALIRLGYIYLNEKMGSLALEAAVKVIKNYSDRDKVDDAYYLLGKIYESDPTLRDVETARRFYKLFLKKAERQENHFKNSPLRKRVASDLKRLEEIYFRYEK